MSARDEIRLRGTWADPAIIRDPRIADRSPIVRAVAERLHGNESSHMHEYIQGATCPYCALRASRCIRWFAEAVAGLPLTHDTPFGLISQECETGQAGTQDTAAGQDPAPFGYVWGAAQDPAPSENRAVATCPRCGDALRSTLQGWVHTRAAQDSLCWKANQAGAHLAEEAQTDGRPVSGQSGGDRP